MSVHANPTELARQLGVQPAAIAGARVTVEATIIRADGTREELGEIAADTIGEAE